MTTFEFKVKVKGNPDDEEDIKSTIQEAVEDFGYDVESIELVEATAPTNELEEGETGNPD